MIDRFKSRPMLAALAAAAITALGVGGVAVAQSGSTSSGQAGQAQSEPAEQPGEENSAADRDDGAGGHADQPGDDAGHEAEGQE